MSAAAPRPSVALAPKLTFIPEILEAHYEDLQFLYAIRRTALRSLRFTRPELAKFEARMAAHLQGMLVVGEKMRDLVEPGLAESDPSIAFAAAFPLLSLGRSTTTQLVLDHFGAAQGPALDGLRDASCHAAPADALPTIEWFSKNAPPRVAAAALEVLTWRKSTPPPLERVRACLTAEEPAVRCTAWRILATLGGADPKDYSAAMRDDEPPVRTEALWAAVWARVPGILALARDYTDDPDPAHLELCRALAVLGTADDRARIEHLGSATKLGAPAVRLTFFGAFGHPSHVEMLIEWMADANPEIAVAAGLAFTRMTGADISSTTIAKLPPAEPTGDPELDDEFAEEAHLPDPQLARAAWSKLKPRLANANKICRGEDVSRGASADQLNNFDMASRWDMSARNRFYGIPGPSVIDLARFPQTPWTG